MTVLPLTALLSLVAPTVLADECNNIQWGPCEERFTALTNATIQRGTLPVPLDYTLLNTTKVSSLELLRVPAAGESRGSILLKFGDPGVVNRDSLALVASDYPR
jgi:hypothetical protein